MLKLRQLLCAAAFCTIVMVNCASAQSTLTQIRDTVYNADGSPFNGTVIVTWNGYANSGGSTIAPYSTSARIYNGALSVLLVPTTTAASGAYYQAVYNSNDGTVTWSEIWSVPPSATALSLNQVRQSSTAGSGSGGTGSGGGSGGTGSGASGGSGSGSSGGTGGTGNSGTVTLPISISNVTGLTDDLNGINSSLTSLTTTVNGLTNTVNSTTTVSGITATVNSLNTTVSGLSTTVSGLSTTVAGHTTTLASLGTSITGLSSTVSGLSSSNSTLNSTLTGLTGTVNSQATTVSGLNTTVSGLSSTVSTHSTSLAGLTTSVTGLTSTVTSQGNTVASQGSTLSTLGTTVTGLTSTVSMQGTTLSGLSTTVGGLSTSVTSHGASIATLNTNVASINSTVSTLSNSLTSLTSTVNSLSSNNTSVAFVDADPLTGTRDGVNAAFTMASTPYPTSSLEVYRNGLVQTVGIDYSLAGRTVTFTSGNAPASGDTISAFYRTTGSGAVSAFADAEVPSGAINGTNAVYTLAAVPNPAVSLRLFKNGMLLGQSTDYSLSGSTVTLNNNVVLQTGDTLLAYYRH